MGHQFECQSLRPYRELIGAIALLFALSGLAFAQTSSGTIAGRVVDSDNQAVPGATVTLIKQDTSESRSFTSDAVGEFVFTAIQPGTYDLIVNLEGFKHYEKRGLALSSSERLSAGDVRLEVGGVTEAVEVKAAIAPVQTVSSERSALLDSSQVTNLMSRGRDIMALLAVLPGVVQTGEGSDALGVFNAPQSMSGTRGIYSGMNIDGISGQTRGGDHLDTPVNMDAIAEVKVLVNSYQAEYGKGAGGIINIVTKTGTRDFHGAVYDYVRNDAFNANSFMNNRQGIPKQDYRYNTFGDNIGGPVFLPGTFNSSKDKLFFFFSQEILHNVAPNGPRNYTVPTALERQGDFSQSIDVSSLQPIFVKDPTKTGACTATVRTACFANNIIPSGRIDPNMQKLLNIFPLPNVTPDKNHPYNLQLSDTLDRPVRQELVRLDYNVSPKVRAWFRAMDMGTHNNGLASTTNNFTWGIGPMDYATTGPNVGGNLTWIINPTVVNEFTLGWAQWTETQSIDQSVLTQLQKQTLGMTLGQLYPGSNPLNLIPTTKFGGITNAAVTKYDPRFPLLDSASTWSLSDSITKVWKEHQFKAGLQAERVVYYQYHTGTANFAGTFDFSKDVNNPGDAGNAYANALLGNFRNYTEATARATYAPVTRILEWYVQDSWKVAHRLTLDLGIRFTAGLPQTAATNDASTFVPARYDPARAPALYRPGLDSQGRRVAIDPTCPTCAPKPDLYVGLLVPGSGDLLNGIVKAGTPGYPEGLVDYQGILPAPRVGFAWNATGDGRTAVRGGFGENYNSRTGPGILGNLTSNPPLIFNPNQYNGSTGTFLQAGTFQGPSAINQSLNRSNPPARAYNTSLGFQRDIGWGTIVDVAYVGSFGRNIGQIRDINQVPYGARFLPQNQDPTTRKPLADDFLRPYQGYGKIPFLTFDGTSSYHSLQTQVTHRVSHNVQFGAAWTWSRALAYTDGDQGTVAANNPPQVWNYGLAAYDRRHVLALNYLIALPSVGRFASHALARGFLDGWQIAGTTRFESGAPLFWGNSINGNDAATAGNSNKFFTASDLSNGADLTGGGDGWRPVVVGNPELPRDQRSFDKWFNTAAFARPAKGDRGNAPSVVARGPGTNNWNMSLFKNIKAGDRVKLQVRAEAYNVFNTTQFSKVDTTPKFDAAGNQVNVNFGRVTATLDPRIMQFALRVLF
ncbi:MAG TPA: carboxypeptidase regulatory-like domain-containing protein [Vicinamibacterales bacterium]|jgi:hypothetical protein|nr:carboxypeptidase regulatory-like domain-containing protein [Vicinamibacterales bacterium]